MRIAEADSKRFEQCEFHASGGRSSAPAPAALGLESGAFGLPLAYYACKRAKGGEFLVFKSSSECQEAFETMQANAP